MKCVQVLPILKHTFSEELTYWSMYDFEVGDLIQVEVNKKKIYAIVSSIVSLSEAKEFIKSRDFKIKKIMEYTKVNFFSRAFILSCLAVSRYYIRPFGEVISEYIPKKVLENIKDLQSSVFVKDSLKKPKTTTKYVQKSFNERMIYIDDLHKTHKNICIIVPTPAQKKHIENRFKNIHVLTPIDLYMLDVLPVDICVLEYAGSSYYRHIRKGFDTRFFVRQYCDMKNLNLIEMDAVLPIYKNIDPKTFCTNSISNVPDVHIIDQSISKTAYVKKQSSTTSSKKKIFSKPEDEADMREFMENSIDIVTHKKLKLISPELYSLIVHAEKKKEDIFIYTTRKGLSTTVVCSDCGHILTCDVCKKPYRLENVKGVRSYMCPYGHNPIFIDSLCPICGGMHIQPLGTGTEALYEELKETVKMPMVVIDSDHMTQSAVRNIFKKRKDQDHVSTIYIGTEIAMHQSLGERFMFGGIASVETFFSLPDSSAELLAARVVESMREKIQDTLVIQTRSIEHILWTCLQEKNWQKLIEQIQKDAEELSLPPFTTHIQITSTKDIKIIQIYLKEYKDISITYLKDQTREIIHVYIKDWMLSPVYIPLYTYLKSLPPYIRIEVDSQGLM